MNFADELKTGVENLINLYDTRSTFTDCEDVTQVGVYEVAHFFYQVPDGMVTTWDDVKEHFVKKYGSRIELRMSRKIITSEIPYRKAVSTRGFLENYGQYYGKEEQRKNLKQSALKLMRKIV